MSSAGFDPAIHSRKGFSMYRFAILSAFVALLAAGLGCKNTSGRCDCNYDPANYALPVTGMTYPTVGAPVTAVPLQVKEVKEGK
jgi:hypothetical protein